jgi:hypothetical protein
MTGAAIAISIRSVFTQSRSTLAGRDEGAGLPGAMARSFRAGYPGGEQMLHRRAAEILLGDSRSLLSALA